MFRYEGEEQRFECPNKTLGNVLTLPTTPRYTTTDIDSNIPNTLDILRVV
jgi:hypothetical protein